MPLQIELIGAAALPILVLTLLRVNAAMVFLSLCLGDVLVRHVAQDENSLINFLAPHTGSISNSSLQLAILTVPALLTTIIMLFSVHGRFRTIFNVFPSIGSGLLLILLAEPLLTPGLRGTIQAQPLWTQINRAEAMIVGISALISLTFLWSQRRHARKMEHDKRRRF